MATHVREGIGNIEGLGLGRFIIPLLVLSAFGPLLLPNLGLRLDQFFVYMLLPIALGFVCVGRRSSLFRGPSLFIIGAFSFITAWTLAVTFGGISENIVASPRTNRDEWVAFEDYFYVIALIFVIGEFVKIHNPEIIRNLIDKICLIVIFIMCLNALLSIASIFIDLTQIISLFVRDLDIAEDDLVGKARKTGIFGAPSTAGFAYSIAILICTYVARKSEKVPIWAYLVGVLIFVGGCVSISKVFLIGGVPLFLVYWFSPGRRTPSISWKVIVIIVGIIGVWLLTIDDLGNKETWRGFYLIGDLFDPDPEQTTYSSFFDLFFRFIEIRYGLGAEAVWEEKPVVGVFPYVWDVAPIQGLGFAYFGIFDSAYMQIFIQGGLVSAIVYMSILLTIIFIGLREWTKGYETGRFLTFLGMLAFLGGIGQPVITISRANVLFWVLILLILALRSAKILRENRLKNI